VFQVSEISPKAAQPSVFKEFVFRNEQKCDKVSWYIYSNVSKIHFWEKLISYQVLIRNLQANKYFMLSHLNSCSSSDGTQALEDDIENGPDQADSSCNQHSSGNSRIHMSTTQVANNLQGNV